MVYLLQVDVGPVQSFIAAARRTSDLAYGSRLLSELSKSGALSMQKQGAELIFPAPQNPAELAPETPLNVANKIVAIVQSDVATAAEDARNAIRQRFEEAIEAAFTNLRRAAPALADLLRFDDARHQLTATIEITWAAVPYTPHQYAIDRHQLEQVMAARKATRDFRAVTWGNHQPKSAIDGRAESVIDWKQAPHDPKFSAMIQSLGIRPNESLAAIDLVKRFGVLNDNHRYMSISHVAAIPFIQRCAQVPLGSAEQQKIASAWESYKNALPAAIRENERVGRVHRSTTFLGASDGTLLFPDRLLADFDSDVYHLALLQAQNLLHHFLKVASSVGIGAPQPYYALLKADGDSMGKLIDHLAEAGPQRHQDITRQLDAFATKARELVNAPFHGEAIYTGGDDVLAFVPLHTVLACAQTLAKEFGEMLQPFRSADDTSPTLSVGIAIAHHLMPLSEVRELADKAERAAKAVKADPQDAKSKDKNGLAILVSKRGGGETLITGNVDTLATSLSTMIDAYRHDLLPDGFGYEIRAMIQRLDGPQSGARLPDTLRGTIAALEARRIVKRKQKEDTRALQEMEGLIPKPLLNKEDHVATPITWKSQAFADELIVARIFAAAQDLAGVSLTDGEVRS